MKRTHNEQDAAGCRAGLSAAINEAGGKANLARLAGVRPQTIASWVKSGQLPDKRLAAVSLGLGIAPEVLRPDLGRLFGKAVPASRRGRK